MRNQDAVQASATPVEGQPMAPGSCMQRCLTEQLGAVGVLPHRQAGSISTCSFTVGICMSGSDGAGGSGGSGSGGGSSGGSSSSNSSGGSDGSGAGHPLRLWTLLYAALLAAGGVMAFVKKGSTKSLTSALGSGVILALSARTMAGPQAKASIAVCLAIAILLSIIMGGRYSRTQKVMPAGVAAGVSLGMSAAYVAALLT
eukprot:gene6642-biopygen8448